MSELWVGTWGVVIGAIMGFGLTELSKRFDQANRTKGYWGALRAEVEECADLATAYIDDNIQAPLYRFERTAYDGVVPELIASGALSARDATALRLFFSTVSQMNRGLDFVDAEIRHHGGGRAEEEHRRNRLKATRIARDGKYYAAAHGVLVAHLV